jgi:spermidine synthase
MTAPFVYRTDETLSLHFDISVVQSEMRCDAPEELVLAYTRTMMGFLLFAPRPRRILMIGLGGGSLAKYCYARLPEASIVVAEIDPRVMALRDAFSVPADEERFRVICADGAEFVREPHATCDVLLVDGFDRAGQSPQLCSPRFYDDCYLRLTHGGLMVVNLGGEEAHWKGSLSGLRCRFGSQVVVVESEDGANRVAFARKGDTLDLTREQFVARLAELERHHSVGLRSTLHSIRYEQFRALAESRPAAAFEAWGR